LAFLLHIEMLQCFANQNALHKTVNMVHVQVVFFVKVMKIPTQKGEHSCKCTELSL